MIASPLNGLIAAFPQLLNTALTFLYSLKYLGNAALIFLSPTLCRK